MVRKLSAKGHEAFEWVDLSTPSPEELADVAKAYNLHPALVNDCLQPDHLPKYEPMEDYDFVIFRVYTTNEIPEADTVQELTSKIAIFYSEKFMVTIHRKPHKLVDDLTTVIQGDKCPRCHDLLNLLIKGCLNTYDPPYNKLAKDVDYYEQMVFLKQRNVPILKGIYYLRRKADLLRRMLILSHEIIDHIDPEAGSVNTRDTRDLYVRLQSLYDSLSDNINQLLNIYFSVSSQRTNDTMRILTIFSVFFMPLTFIVGIYGMNFEFMPELKWKLGYPSVMALMVIIIVLIYIWFKRKKWL
jgi:magnesium transporter